MKKIILFLFIGFLFGLWLDTLALDTKIPKTVVLRCKKTSNFNKCIETFKQKQILKLRTEQQAVEQIKTTNTVNTTTAIPLKI